MQRRNRTKTAYLSPDHLEEQAEARAKEAEQLPAGEAKENALRAAAQIRSYAEMKRMLLAPQRQEPAKKASTSAREMDTKCP